MLTNRADRFANYQKAQQDSSPGQMSTYGVMQREAPQDNRQFGEDYYRSMYARAEGMNPQQRRNLEMQSAREQGFYQGPQNNSRDRLNSTRNPNARPNSMMPRQRASIGRYMGGMPTNSMRSFAQPEPTMQQSQSTGGYRGYQPTRSRMPMQQPQTRAYAPVQFPGQQKIRAQPQNSFSQRLGGLAQNQRMMYDGSTEDFINSR